MMYTARSVESSSRTSCCKPVITRKPDSKKAKIQMWSTSLIMISTCSHSISRRTRSRLTSISKAMKGKTPLEENPLQLDSRKSPKISNSPYVKVKWSSSHMQEDRF